MSRHLQTRIVLHGAILLLVGSLYGIPFGVAIRNAWGDEAVRAWRVAHSAGVTVGLTLIAIGAIVDRIRLGDVAASVLVWSLVTSGYCFALGVVVAATTGVRGLGPGGTLLDGLVFVSYMVGSLGMVFGFALTIRGACAALRRTSA